MNTTPQPLVSATARFIAAATVASIMAAVSMGAAQASDQAVRTCAETLTRTHITLDRVEVVAKRDSRANI